MTRYLTYIPQSPLTAFVDKFWLYEGDYPSHEKERVLPHGSLELFINLNEDRINVYDHKDYNRFQRFRGSLISGPHTGFSVIDTTCLTSIMGVHFRPGGVSPFLNFPAAELRDAHVPLDSLWGPAANDLREQLLVAGTPYAKFQILEHFLMKQTVAPLVQHPAVAFALKKFEDFPGMVAISDVTEQISLSPRRFIQVFKEEVGLTPKRYCRIRRFQEVLKLIGSGQQVDWTDVAMACGYFDQAHFIHDFRSFSGLNPTTYLTHRGEHHNHVPLSK